MASTDWKSYNYLGMASKQTGLVNFGKTPGASIPQDPVTPEDIQNGTDRVKLVDEHTENIQSFSGLSESEFQRLLRVFPYTSGMHSVYPNVELIPENVVDIRTLSEEHAGKVLEGKFLLCRTITPAYQLRGIQTVVEDPQGKRAIRLALFKYSPTVPGVTNFDAVLPTGSFLAIKNPWFKNAGLHRKGLLGFPCENPCLVEVIEEKKGYLVLMCENPAQVELLSLKAVTKMFPDVKWEGEIPQLDNFPNENFWSIASGTERETAEVLKKLGNVAFVEKRFTDSIRWYNLALDYANDDEDFLVNIYSNRASMFLNMRCFYRAIDDANRVLEKKPNHVKAVYRKMKALMGLAKYGEAVAFISEKMRIHAELAENQELLPIAECARNLLSQLEQELVDVDMMKLLNVSEAVDSIDDVLQYTGPLERNPLKLNQDGSGDSRGLVATEDIHPGQLLISSKAFAYHKIKSHRSGNLPYENKLSGYNLDSVYEEHFAVSGQVVYKIHFEPEESGREMYKLFAGPELGPVPEDSDVNRLIDMDRIHRLVRFNSFSTGLAPRVDYAEKGYQFYTYSGLWILPSLINHTCCDANATWCNIGDIFLLRAMKEIKKGEEIKISYVLPTFEYEDRKKFNDSCACRLCELDVADNESGMKAMRLMLYKKLDFFMYNNPRGVHFPTVLETVSEMEGLRRGNNWKLNACLSNGVVEEAVTMLFRVGRYGDCRSWFEKIYAIEKELGVLPRGIASVLIILRCSLDMKDREGVLRWLKQLKEDVIAAYGSTKFLKAVVLGDGVNLIPSLRDIGINLED